MPAASDPRAKTMKKFHALDQDGIARIGEKLNDGDIYINKYRPQAQIDPKTQQAIPSTISYRPEEQSFRGTNHVYVDRMILTSNNEEKCIIKMITR